MEPPVRLEPETPLLPISKPYSILLVKIQHPKHLIILLLPYILKYTRTFFKDFTFKKIMYLFPKHVIINNFVMENSFNVQYQICATANGPSRDLSLYYMTY